MRPVDAESRRFLFNEVHAFLWTPTRGMEDLGSLGGRLAEAWAVTDTDQVVGFSDLPGGTQRHVFSWTRNDGLIDLGTLGGTQSMIATVNSHIVSNRGQVVGFSSIDAAGIGSHAFAWTARQGMTDLGGLGWRFTYAQGINQRGEIVGTSDLPGQAGTHAVIWRRHGAHNEDD